MSELATAARALSHSIRRVVGAVALGVMACGEPAEDSSRALRARAEPHLREFEAFDAWARRSLDADLAVRDVRALEETIFAPIRRDADVVAAWVEREGPDPRRHGLHTDEPLMYEWVELRAVPMLPRLQVAEAELPDPRAPRASRAPRVRALVLSREVASARGGGDVRVTVAYRAQASPE